jgi:hypothetical protein
MDEGKKRERKEARMIKEVSKKRGKHGIERRRKRQGN